MSEEAIAALQRACDVARKAIEDAIDAPYTFEVDRSTLDNGSIRVTITAHPNAAIRAGLLKVGDPIHLGNDGVAYLPGPGRAANACIALIEPEPPTCSR